MKKWVIVIFLILAPLTGLAMKEGGGRKEKGHETPAEHPEMYTNSQAGKGIQKYAEDGRPGDREDFSLQPAHDNEIFAVFMGDRLEYRTREGEDALLWDIQTWVGEDYNKLYLESEGTRLLDEGEYGGVDLELFYGRNVSSFWDLRAGLRYDLEPGPARAFGIVGVQGLAPYMYEVEANAYVSEDGDVSVAAEAEYDILISQRLILQPRFETGIALQEVEEYGVGQGINDIELDARLRYEILRELAPYIGVSWEKKLGETAEFAEDAGEDTDTVFWVAGLKYWF